MLQTTNQTFQYLADLQEFMHLKIILIMPAMGMIFPNASISVPSQWSAIHPDCISIFHAHSWQKINE